MTINETQIRNMFRDYPLGTVFLLKVAPEDYQSATTALLETAGDNDTDVIYVGVKRPYVHFRNTLDKNNLVTDRVHVIDAITKTITEEGIVEGDHVRYLNSPQNLTNISTSISVVANQFAGTDTLVMIDSLETLLTYNSEHEVSNFLNDLKNRTKTLDLNLALFKRSKELDEKIGSELYPLVDEILFISGKDTDAVTVQLDDDHATLKIPIDVARSLRWDHGDELDYTITDDGALELENE